MGIMTVNGVIPKEKLGITTPHEHALIDISNQYPGDRTPGCTGWDGKVAPQHYEALRNDPYALRDNLMLDDQELAIQEVALFAKAGGNTFVDVTLPSIGRDVDFLVRLSRETGLQVVAATGYYTADAHPAKVQTMSVEELAEEMICDLTVGMDGTNRKAGIIGEIGTSFELLAEEIRTLQASAIAHKETGAPVMVHLSPWAKHGLAVLDILEAGGVDPARVCLCHTDILLDVAYMKAIMDRGAYLEFDNFGKEFPNGTAYGRFPKDTERVEVLCQLLRDGYADRILLSCDVCLKTLLVAHQGPGYAHVLLKIAAMLREKCPDAEEVLHTLLVKNPACYLDNPRL